MIEAMRRFHGVQLDGKNYERLARIRTGMNLVILDGCRNNRFACAFAAQRRPDSSAWTPPPNR